MARILTVPKKTAKLTDGYNEYSPRTMIG